MWKSPKKTAIKITGKSQAATTTIFFLIDQNKTKVFYILGSSTVLTGSEVA